MTALNINLAPGNTKVSKEDFREILYDSMDQMIYAKTKVHVGRTFAKQLTIRICAILFKRVITAGVVRLPAGFGSLVQTTFPGAARKLPDGTPIAARGPRPVIRYRMGVAVKRWLGVENHPTKAGYPRKPRKYWRDKEVAATLEDLL